MATVSADRSVVVAREIRHERPSRIVRSTCDEVGAPSAGIIEHLEDWRLPKCVRLLFEAG